MKGTRRAFLQVAASTPFAAALGPILPAGLLGKVRNMGWQRLKGTRLEGDPPQSQGCVRVV
jgi:hypothetical protein